MEGNIDTGLTLVKDVLTILVLVFGTIAAALYSRVLYAQIQIQVDLDQVINWPGNDDKAIIVTVRVKNIGRARVTKNGCYIEVGDFTSDQTNLSRYVPVKKKPWQLGCNSVNEIFDTTLTTICHCKAARNTLVLGPNEEAVEDVLIPLDGSESTIEVAVRFDSKTGPIRGVFYGDVARSWTLRRILDVGNTSGE